MKVLPPHYDDESSNATSPIESQILNIRKFFLELSQLIARTDHKGGKPLFRKKQKRPKSTQTLFTESKVLKL